MTRLIFCTRITPVDLQMTEATISWAESYIYERAIPNRHSSSIIYESGEPYRTLECLRLNIRWIKVY